VTRRVPILMAATILVWTLPRAASADTVSCSYDAGTKTATVSITPDPTALTTYLSRSGNSIMVGGTACGTVTNTDTIVLNDTSANGDVRRFAVILADYAPGFTDEPGTSDEIEFVVNFGEGGSPTPGDPLGGQDFLSLFGQTSTVPLNIQLGGNQINLNAGEGDGIDADVTMNGVERVIFTGSAADDRIVGSGGLGTPPTPGSTRMVIGDAGGNNTFVGSALSDEITSGGGADLIEGGPGGDNLLSGGGNDIIVAGAGKDLTVDAGPGSDKVLGGPGNDLDLEGGGGKDAIRGQGGRDQLFGQGGNDKLNGGAGKKDSCKGGPGNDQFTGCEEAIE